MVYNVLLKSDICLRSAFPSRPIKVVVGFRRSGKSWLCMQVARELVENGQCELGDVLILNFEDYRLSDIRSPEDLDRVRNLFRALSPKPGKKLILLDEIQTVPGWDRFLRTLYERDDTLELLVTGERGFAFIWKKAKRTFPNVMVSKFRSNPSCGGCW